MIRLIPRHRADPGYFTRDSALELDGIRDGPAGWFVGSDGRPPSEADLRELWQPSSRSATVGIDLIVAAPRMVSIVVAVGDDSQARAVVAAHRAAVAQTVNFIEAFSWRDRFTSGEVDIYQQRPLGPTPSFTHGVNRAGEPHLHDHVLLAVRQSENGRTVRWGDLRDDLLALDRIYKSALRAGVMERGGPAIWRGFVGDEHVVGFDEGWRAMWPGHHERGEVKKIWTREEIRTQWQQTRERFEHQVGELAPPRARFDVHHAEMLWRESLRRRAIDGLGIVAAAYRWGTTLDVRDRGLRDLDISDYAHFREVLEPHRDFPAYDRSLSLERSR